MAIKKYGIVIASFGNRDDYINSLISNIRKFTDIDIWLISDKIRPNLNCNQVDRSKELLWKDHSRYGVRNCNLWLARASLSLLYDAVLCLNDDMRIVNKGFMDGFLMAEKFGCCVPTNPRIYVKYNAMGADTTEKDYKSEMDGPQYAPSCNMSPMFFSANIPAARELLIRYEQELMSCMRGTLAFWKASWKTGFSPLYLPEQWCVCASNAKYIRDYKKILQGKTYSIEPIMLHWGQAEVREVFKGIIE